MFFFGLQTVRKGSHTYLLLLLSLLSSRIQTPACVCVVRGVVALFGKVAAFTGVLWIVTESLYNFPILLEGLI